MIGSGLLGLVLLIVGGMHVKKNRRWIASLFMGAIFLAIAIWLGWPK